MKNDANISCLRCVAVSPLLQLARNFVSSAGLTLARNFHLSRTSPDQKLPLKEAAIFLLCFIA